MSKTNQLEQFRLIERAIGVASVILSIYWLLSVAPVTDYHTGLALFVSIQGIVFLGLYRLIAGLSLIYFSRKGSLTARRRTVAADAAGRTYALVGVFFAGGASIASVTGFLVIVIEVIMYFHMALHDKT